MSGQVAAEFASSPMTAPVPPAVAGEIFGDRLALAGRYADLLADAGLVRGLIGPREVPRLWERHLVNCAVLTELLPAGAAVVDVGSGAGLPGLTLAIRRPDLAVTLVEPLQRRTQFLTEAVDHLGLGRQVRVVRGRAEEMPVRDALSGTDWVTARAVAPLDRLAGWCLPLLRSGGALLAIKGAGADTEVAEHRNALRRLGAGEVDVVTCGSDLLVEPTTVVRIWRTDVQREGRR